MARIGAWIQQETVNCTYVKILGSLSRWLLLPPPGSPPPLLPPLLFGFGGVGACGPLDGAVGGVGFGMGGKQ